MTKSNNPSGTDGLAAEIRSGSADLTADTNNPYAVGLPAPASDCSWTDQEIEFNLSEIRVTGDTELPQLCLKSGESSNLIQRSQTFRAMPRALQGLITFPCLAILAFVFISDWTPWATMSDDLGMFLPLIFVAAGTAHHVLGKKVHVTWYLSDSYARRASMRRQILAVTAIVSGGLIVVSIYYTGHSWTLPAFVVIFSLAAVLLGRESKISVRHVLDGRFILHGHSRAFTEAWVRQTEDGAAPTAEQDVPDQDGDDNGWRQR